MTCLGKTVFYSHFDARGTHGREAGWTLYFSLVAEEMGREAGTAGAFIMPAARSYAVTPPASVAGPVVQAAANVAIAPNGWTLSAGGPVSAFVAPAAREHGLPGTAADVAGSALRNVAIGDGSTTPRTLVDPADVPPHLPAPQPNPSPDHAQVHLTSAEWAALIKGRWERNDASKKKKFTFLQQHRMTEFHVEGDPFTYRVGADGRMAAVYDAQTQKAYNVTGTRKGFAGIPLTLNGEPTYAGTEHMYPVTGNQRNVVQIQMVGNRDGDFKAANEAAGLTDVVKAQGRRPERAPEGYTWHHRDDFVPTTGTPPPYGTCTMELVKDKAHRATLEHFGSCDQCNKYTGLTLYK